MKDFLLASGGLVVAIAVPLLTNIGFSGSCGNEIVQIVGNYVAPLLAGGFAWKGLTGASGRTLGGLKKPV